MRRSASDESEDPTPPVVTPEPDQDVSGVPGAPEAFKRPEALYFVGALLPNGEPAEHLAGYGLNAADYPPGDPWLARLTDDQIALALSSKLYQRTKPKGRDED